MRVRLKCPTCQGVLLVREQDLGTTARCPRCRHPVQLPAAAAPVDPPATQAPPSPSAAPGPDTGDFAVAPSEADETFRLRGLDGLGLEVCPKCQSEAIVQDEHREDGPSVDGGAGFLLFGRYAPLARLAMDSEETGVGRLTNRRCTVCGHRWFTLT